MRISPRVMIATALLQTMLADQSKPITSATSFALTGLPTLTILSKSRSAASILVTRFNGKENRILVEDTRIPIWL